MFAWTEGRYQIWKAQDPESVEEFFNDEPDSRIWERDQGEEHTRLLSFHEPQSGNPVNGHGSLIASVDD
jgi:hypothetical protein